MSKQLCHMIAIPDAQYHDLMSDLKAGKKAYLSSQFEEKDRVELRGPDGQVFEIATNRLVVALSTTVSNQSNTKTLSLWGKLVLAFGYPSMGKRPEDDVTQIFVYRSRDGDIPILMYHDEQKVLFLPGFWNVIDQWKTLFGDVFHHETTLCDLFNEYNAQASDEAPSAFTLPTSVALLIKWE